jgi:hypothetical protein
MEGEPGFLTQFKNSGIWMVCSFFFFMDIHAIIIYKYQIEDVAGNDEVTVHRKFGNEQYVGSAMCTIAG